MGFSWGGWGEMASQTTWTDTPHLRMQININGRGAFLGAFAAIALAALTAAQLPSLQARSAGGGYMGLMGQGRELWRFTGQEQFETGAGYTVPAGKELVICGIASTGDYEDGTGESRVLAGLIVVAVDGQELIQGTYSRYAYQGASSTTFFPGLLVGEGQVVSIGKDGTLTDNLLSIAGSCPVIYGYLRDL